MKSKAGTKKSTVMVPRRDLHVRDCMTWPDPDMEMSKENDHSSDQNTFRIQKAELGKPVDRGYTMLPPLGPAPNDGDRAVEALRGWPNRDQDQEEPQTNEFEDFMKGYGVAGGGVNPYADYERASAGGNKNKGKGKKEKGKRGRGYEAEYDAHISDLISHRYMYEAAMRRQQEAARKEQEELEARRARNSRRFPQDIKANKTSQLRSIAMAEKVTTNPKDLWQMSKFKDNAQPALDTKRGKSKGKGSATGSRLGSRLNSAEPHPTCTCAEEFSGYRGADNDRYQVQDYPTVDYGDTQGADKVEATQLLNETGKSEDPVENPICAETVVAM